MLKDLIALPSLWKKLENTEYCTVDDLRDKGVLQLAQELNLEQEDIVALSALLYKDMSTQAAVPASDLIKDAHSYGIRSCSTQLDKLLGADFANHAMTEISGCSGTGKTQLCLQLAVNVQLPVSNGGQGGQCIYIDTEGSCFKERLARMLKRYQGSDRDALSLGNIHLFRVLDHLQLVALLSDLPRILRELPRVKLVIVDSIAFPLRMHIRDYRLRRSLMNFAGQALLNLSNQFNIKCVVTNHMGKSRFTDAWCPALGPTWAQWCRQRVILRRRRQYRYAYLYSEKEDRASDVAPFIISSDGIDEADEATLMLLVRTIHHEQQQDYAAQGVVDTMQPSASANDDDDGADELYDDDMWNQQGFMDAILSQIPENMETSALDSQAVAAARPVHYTLAPDSQSDNGFSDGLDDMAMGELEAEADEEHSNERDNAMATSSKRTHSDLNEPEPKRAHVYVEDSDAESWDDHDDEQWLSALIDT